MFDFDLKPIELLLRALLVYAVLLIMLRISGKRTVGQFTPFDLLVVMLVSEAAGPAMTGADESVWGGLMVCIILIILNAGVSFIVARSRTAEKIFEGEAILIGRDGEVFEGLRKKHRISFNDIETLCRKENCKIKEMEYLFLESNGGLTMKKNS